jgi:hypothetical protein
MKMNRIVRFTPVREPKKLENKTTRQMTEPNAISNAIGYAKFYSRSHDAVIHVYDDAGNVIETHEHAADFKEWRAGGEAKSRHALKRDG